MNKRLGTPINLFNIIINTISIDKHHLVMKKVPIYILIEEIKVYS